MGVTNWPVRLSYSVEMSHHLGRSDTTDTSKYRYFSSDTTSIAIETYLDFEHGVSEHCYWNSSSYLLLLFIPAFTIKKQLNQMETSVPCKRLFSKA